MMTGCFCGGPQDFDRCCGPLLKGERAAATAEALLRSRYTAYVKGEIDYLRETTHPSARDAFDPVSARKWSKGSRWEGLQILRTEAGQEADRKGTVEFVATYVQDGETVEHHEEAQFLRDRDRWYFVDGRIVGQAPFVREAPKVGRNAPCPCGSGKKHKKCCGR